MADEQQPKYSRDEPPRTHVSARVPDSIGLGVFASTTVVMATPHELVLDFLQILIQPHQLVSRVIVPWPTVPQLIVALRQDLGKYDARFRRSDLVTVDKKHLKKATEQVPSPATPDDPVEQSRQPGIPGNALPVQSTFESASPSPAASNPPESDPPASNPPASNPPASGSPVPLPPSPGGDKPVIVTRQVRAQSFYDELRLDNEVLRGNYANGAMINHTEFEFKIDFLTTLAPHPVVTARIFLAEPQVRRLLAAIEENEGRRRRS